VVQSALAADPALEVDRLDLFADPLPAFGEQAALAKMDVIGGRPVAPARRQAWDDALATAERLVDAPLWVFAVPMWNGGLPWPLKQLIDTVTQPGVAFGFDPVAGYSGLLAGHRAVAVYTSHVFSPGVAPAFGVDHHSTYLRWWLDFVGAELAGEVRLQTTYPGDPTLAERRAAALEQARVIGGRLVEGVPA
jgi:FMN-dependent NADH-azoreductase